MRVNGETNSARGSEDRNGQTAVATRVTGLTIKQTDSGNCSMLTEMFTKANGKTTKPMVKEHTLMLTVLVIRETGETTSSTGSVLRHGLMELSMKDNTLRAKRMAKESLLSQMDQFTTEISR